MEKDYILATDNKIDLKSLDLDELKECIKDMGEPAFRAKQLYEWLHVKQASGYEDMTNIPKSLKEALQGLFFYKP